MRERECVVSKVSQVVVKRITFCGRNCVFPPFSFVSFIVSVAFNIFCSCFSFVDDVVVVVAVDVVVRFSIVLFELLHIVVVSA